MTSSPGVREPATISSVLVLSNPWLDCTIALIAILPIAWLTKYRYEHMKLGLPLLSLGIGSLILIVTMVLGRPLKRVTPNPLYWLLAFVAAYWTLLTLSVFQQGQQIVPNSVTDTIAVWSLAVLVWARLSLGRNIGFVPAQRQVVTGGAYRYMRHSIYTGTFLAYFGLALRACIRNALIMGIGIFWFCIKSVVEENFLRADPQHAAYLRSVRARWIPFVV